MEIGYVASMKCFSVDTHVSPYPFYSFFSKFLPQGVHADIDKWVFEDGDTPYDYSCTTSKGPGRARRGRLLKKQDRRLLLEKHGVDMSPEEYADNLYSRVTHDCTSCSSASARDLLANKMLDAKLNFVKKGK